MAVVALVVALVALVAAFVASGSAKRYANDRIVEILSGSAARHTEIVRDIRLILDRQGRADDLIGNLTLNADITGKKVAQLDAIVADLNTAAAVIPAAPVEPAAKLARKPRKAAAPKS